MEITALHLRRVCTTSHSNVNDTLVASLHYFNNYPEFVSFTSVILSTISVVVGLVGLASNFVTLVVCANRIMWERPMSKYMIPIAICDIIFILLTMGIIVIPTISDFHFACSVSPLVIVIMGWLYMSTVYLVMTMAYERLWQIIDPFDRAGWSLPAKTAYSAKLSAVAFITGIFINIPRFWSQNINENGSGTITWIYGILLDGIVPFLILMVFGVWIFVKYTLTQTELRKVLGDKQRKRKSRIGTYIALIFMMVVAVTFLFASFITFASANDSESAFNFYHLTILILITISSVKFCAYYYWGVYFIKAFKDVFGM